MFILPFPSHPETGLLHGAYENALTPRGLRPRVKEPLENLAQIRASDLVQRVLDPHRRLVHLDQTPQIDRRRDDNDVAVSLIDRRLEITNLLIAVSHGGQNRTDIRILGKRLLQLADQVRTRVDQRTDRWVEIVLDDGKVGWVPAGAMEII